MVNGKGLRDLRKEMGLSQAKMAELLGVARTTVWRWEQQPAAEIDPDDPRTAELLRMLDEDIATERRAELGKKIMGGILLGGALFGLFLVLEDVFNDKPRPKRRNCSGGTGGPAGPAIRPHPEALRTVR